MKKHIKMLVAALLLCFALVPAAKAEAAQLANPSGVKLYSQNIEYDYVSYDFCFIWNFDSSISYYGGDWGYEVAIKNTSGKTLMTLNSSNYSANYKFVVLNDGSVGVLVKNSSLAKQPFKVYVKSFAYDVNGQMYTSNYSNKQIIPRAKVKSIAKAGNNKAKVKWQKVKGAKNYTVYLSKNNGKSYKKLGTTSKTNYTFSTKGFSYYKGYYVYVQPNKVKVGKKKLSATKPTDKSSGAYGFTITVKYY